MKFYKLSKIVKKDNKYQVQSEKGRNLGTYDSKSKAEERLKQVEMFKHMKKKSSFDNDKFTFKFDLSQADSKQIDDGWFSTKDYASKNPKIQEILNIDPKAEIWDVKWDGIIIWKLSFATNNYGVEWAYIIAKPSKVFANVTIAYYKNKEDELNDNPTEEVLEVPFDLVEIKVEAENPFQGTSLYPNKIVFDDFHSATLEFDI